MSIELTEKTLEEILQKMRDLGNEDALNGVAVLHAAAAIHKEFVEPGLINFIIDSLEEVDKLPVLKGVDNLADAWKSAFYFLTHPEGLSSLCFAMNEMAEIVADGKKAFGTPTSELKETELQ